MGNIYYYNKNMIASIFHIVNSFFNIQSEASNRTAGYQKVSTKKLPDSPEVTYYCVFVQVLLKFPFSKIEKGLVTGSVTCVAKHYYLYKWRSIIAANSSATNSAPLLFK
jgi:hypothetical protein